MDNAPRDECQEYWQDARQRNTDGVCPMRELPALEIQPQRPYLPRYREDRDDTSK